MSRRIHGAEYLSEARASYSRGLFLLRCFVNETSQTRKKEEALRRVLLFRWTVAESLQSTCQDVGRRGHHWLYHRLRRRCRPQ